MDVSASSIFVLTTSTRLTHLRFPASTWNRLTLSIPSSSCCLMPSSSFRAASAAPSASRPTSTVFSDTYLAASAIADCASDPALSMRASTSLASSAAIVSRPIRNGASVSRIFISTSSIDATRSCACLRIGIAAARDCASSTVCCARSSKDCEASARDCKSSIFARMGPFSPATFPDMRRMVGANVACATRTASFVSRISFVLISLGVVSKAFANGSDIMDAFSQSISTPANRWARSPNNFSPCNASSWSFRTVLNSSSLAWLASRRGMSLSISSSACSFTVGAKPSTCFWKASISRRILRSAVDATFTARSVSRMALICSSFSSSTASIVNGAATIATFSTSSSADDTFSSKVGNISSNFWLSRSSFSLFATGLVA
mmetsp:Transcript_103078/g.204663  ORF Transcript_103078/g.204663 Transcript_103078/m.204663 type:complete len:377 (+) Transcript_103078:2609-3739(+)